jgi:hypothetical protein
MTYSEKLRDPKWQKKRLEVFKRDKFTCQICMAKDKTLAVHHKKYVKGKEPWDYKNEYLITLCVDCHEKLKDKIPYKQNPRYAFVIDRDKIIDRNGDPGVVIDLTTLELLFSCFVCGPRSTEALDCLLHTGVIEFDSDDELERATFVDGLKNFFLDLEKAKYLIYDEQFVRDSVSQGIGKCIASIEDYYFPAGDK